HVEQVRKALEQQIGDNETQLGRRELPAFLLYVLALLDRRQNRRIRRWPSDPIGFELFDHRRFRITRCRLRELLLRLERLELQNLALCNRRELVLELVVLFVLLVLALFVNTQEAVKLLDTSRSPEDVARAVLALGDNINGRLIEQRRIHLASDESHPDQ